jgi:hypothetical protein
MIHPTLITPQNSNVVDNVVKAGRIVGRIWASGRSPTAREPKMG